MPLPTNLIAAVSPLARLERSPTSAPQSRQSLAAASAISASSATTRHSRRLAPESGNERKSAHHETGAQSAAPTKIRRRQDKQTPAGPWDHWGEMGRGHARNILPGFPPRCRHHKDRVGATAVLAPPANVDIDPKDFPADARALPRPRSDSRPEFDQRKTTCPPPRAQPQKR